MAVRLVVFDLDGTLVDSGRDLAAAVNATLLRLAPALAPLDLDEVVSFIGSGARVLVARSLAAAGLPEPPEDVLPLFMEEYGKRLLDTTRLYPGVVEALDALADRRLAVLTNKPAGLSRAILQGLGVEGRFFRVYGGDDFPTRKPDPQGLRTLMADAAAGPAETALVGDSAVDVRTARAAGVRALAVDYGFDRASLSEDPPDALLSDLRQLPGLLAAPAAVVLPSPS
jgi:phosphoglycolate phosphatase